MTALTIVAMMASFALLSVAMRSLPLGSRRRRRESFYEV